MAAQDEKARSFFVTVPQKWRLFWLMNIISLSFALALVGVVYVGNPSAVNEGTGDGDDGVSGEGSILNYLPTWFVFAVNPAALTFFTFSASRLLQAVCDTRDDINTAGHKAGGGERWPLKVLRNGVSSAVNAARLEPGFYTVLAAWLVVSGTSWLQASEDSPHAVAVASFTSTESDDFFEDRHGPELTSNTTELVAANLALAAGLVTMAACSARGRAWSPITTTPGPRRRASSRQSAEDRGGTDPTTRRRSRVPSLLVGWGLGYWLGSLLYLLGSSWPKGAWGGAPLTVAIVGYVVLPGTFLLGVFVVADSDVYGAGVEGVLRPVARALREDDRVLHWAMVTLLRDVTFLWIVFMELAVPFLNII